MSDICLCYASEDREKAVKLFAFLRGADNGFSVSMTLPGEVNYPAELRLFGSLVEGATVALVLWSKAARGSAFLSEMRKYTRPGSTLVALLEQAEPPPAAERVGIVDLSGWDGVEALKAIPSSGPSGMEARVQNFRAGRHEPPVRGWGQQLNSLVLFIRYIMREKSNRSANAGATANAAPPSAAPTADAGPKPSAPSASPAVAPAQKVVRRSVRGSLASQRRADEEQPRAAEPQPRAAVPQTQTGHAGARGFEGVFISYRRSDAAAYARGLYDRLAARFGREQVFLDVENVAWGEDFVEAITAAAGSCAVMIALISRGWARGEGGHEGGDDFVRLEVSKALGRKIRVIPILIQGATMPAPKDLPEDLSPLLRRNAHTLSDTRWERDVEDLVKALEGLLKA